MEKVMIAVGSMRGPKRDAMRDALSSFGPLLQKDAEFEIEAVDVPTGVRHTPLSRGELMAGARRRAEALRIIAQQESKSWQYFVGLEGGFNIVHEDSRRWVFLESWAYVSDEHGRESFGVSGGVLVPAPLAQRVLDQGVELAEAIDSFAGASGIRDGQGAWGVFTRSLVTRREAFRVAILNAFAPFFNHDAYSRQAKGARV
jgi:inosine/xanthosine triphosphatase